MINVKLSKVYIPEDTEPSEELDKINNIANGIAKTLGFELSGEVAIDTTNGKTFKFGIVDMSTSVDIMIDG